MSEVTEAEKKTYTEGLNPRDVQNSEECCRDSILLHTHTVRKHCAVSFKGALDWALPSLNLLVLNPTSFVNLSKSPEIYEIHFLTHETEVLFALPDYLGCYEGQMRQ